MMRVAEEQPFRSKSLTKASWLTEQASRKTSASTPHPSKKKIEEMIQKPEKKSKKEKSIFLPFLSIELNLIIGSLHLFQLRYLLLGRLGFWLTWVLPNETQKRTFFPFTNFHYDKTKCSLTSQTLERLSHRRWPMRLLYEFSDLASLPIGSRRSTITIQ